MLRRVDMNLDSTRLTLLGSLALLVTACATDPAATDDGFRGGSKADDPYGWSHVVLSSASQVGISVDYVSNFHADTTSYKPTNVDSASPLYANVWGDQLTGDESVRVVLMNYEPLGFDSCDKRQIPYTWAMDLTWQGDHFSANLGEDAEVTRSYLHWDPGTVPFTTRWSGYGGNRPFCQEIAVVVDGEWQVDPVSNGHNFSFDMYAAH